MILARKVQWDMCPHSDLWLEDIFIYAVRDVAHEQTMKNSNIRHLHGNMKYEIVFQAENTQIFSWATLGFNFSLKTQCLLWEKQNNLCEKQSKAWCFLAKCLKTINNQALGKKRKNSEKYSLKSNFVTFLNSGILCMSLTSVSIPCLPSGWRPSLCHRFSLQQVLCLLQYWWRTRRHSSTGLWP